MTMRILTKPSTACCTLAIYIFFLLGEPKRTTCTRLAEIFSLSHDSVNRFLEREDYTPYDLWEAVNSQIVLEGGTVNVDDTVLDKPYSNPLRTDLIDYFWSGKHKKSVKGINLITLYYTDINQVSVPINFRVVDKSSGKTKNEYFREMLKEVLTWGLKPSWVTGDIWYSGKNNLKCVRHHMLGFMFAIKGNRLVSIEKGKYVQVQNVSIPESGLSLHLKDFGNIKVFRTIFKDEYRYYIMYAPNIEKLNQLTYKDFKHIHDNHWQIETYHRAIKQVCNIEHFQVRKTRAIKNHIFCSIRAFVQLEFMRVQGTITNWYEVQKNLFLEVIREFVQKSILSSNGGLI